MTKITRRKKKTTTKKQESDTTQVEASEQSPTEDAIAQTETKPAETPNTQEAAKDSGMVDKVMISNEEREERLKRNQGLKIQALRRSESGYTIATVIDVDGLRKAIFIEKDGNEAYAKAEGYVRGNYDNKVKELETEIVRLGKLIREERALRPI